MTSSIGLLASRLESSTIDFLRKLVTKCKDAGWVSPSVILHWKDKKTKARKYLTKRQIVECITRASETRPQQIAELYEEVIAEDKDRDDQLEIQEMKSVYERGRSRPLDAESNVLFEENIGGRRKRQKVHVTPAGRRGKFLQGEARARRCRLINNTYADGYANGFAAALSEVRGAADELVMACERSCVACSGAAHAWGDALQQARPNLGYVQL